MASAVSSHSWLARNTLQIWDHDPGTTDAKVVSADGGTTEKWIDMKDYGRLVVAVVATVFGGNGPTLVEIVASDSADETDSSVTQVKTSGTVVLNALGEWAVLECTAEEIAQLASSTGYSLRYATARITCHHAGDEALVMLLGTDAVRMHLDKTSSPNTL